MIATNRLMLKPNDFYEQYDALIGRICKPYQAFLEETAARIPFDATTICDIGIGTGNLSHAARRRFPWLRVIGIDGNANSLRIAKGKITGLEGVIGDAFQGALPRADYYLTSLTLHHLRPEDRDRRIRQILNSGRGLLNFDIFLFDGKSKEDAITEVSNFAALHFPDNEDQRMIADEMRRNDHPSQLYEDAKIARDEGFRFSIIAQEFPYVAYSAIRR